MYDTKLVPPYHYCTHKTPTSTRRRSRSALATLATTIAAALLGLGSVHAAVTIQQATDEVTGTNAWAFLRLEAESFETQADDNPDAGFAVVDKTGAVTSFLGTPILAPASTASGTGALFTKTIFAEHADKVTYKVQFSKAGTYYLYMRFTVFENGGSEGSYGNEDSFFVPPDFGKDPQTDWPLPRGGYAEGCCGGSGYLFVKDGPETDRVDHLAGNEENRLYWEGNFHWNQLISSQFNNPETAGEPNYVFKYEVSADQLGKPLDFTISYREGGTTIDLFLFSTNPALLDSYSQADLDRLLLAGSNASVTIQSPTDKAGTGTNTFSYLLLEGEDYDSELNDAEGSGFDRIDKSGTMMSFLGNPLLATNSTASGTGALFTRTIFSEHADKVTYQVQFVTPGTYYLYMRFTMFENGGSEGSYGNEDSFFVPPDFGKDPQTDWPLPRGGYAEGCCGGSGYLFVKDGPETDRVDHLAGNEENRLYWEGNLHWNQLISSQFNNPETAGEPNYAFRYEVTADRVGKPLDFTISYREGGTAIDAFLFSTDPALLDNFTQAQLDQMILGIGGTSGNPTLLISRNGTSVVLSWPTSAAGFAIETSGSLSSPAWTSVATAAVVNGDQNTVTVTIAGSPAFYRLKKP